MRLGTFGAGQMHGQPSIGDAVALRVPRHRDYIIETIFVKVSDSSPTRSERHPESTWTSGVRCGTEVAQAGEDAGPAGAGFRLAIMAREG
jgi:hypothetical protein